MSDLRRAAELCEFCPKMCRFACPASEVSSREAWTPWGKVSLAALAGRAPDESAALAFGACSGCLRCQTYCAHANDVPAILYAARATAVRAGEVAASSAAERVVQVTARRFSYNPDVIELELGVPAVIELTSLDRAHGFAVAELGLRIDVEPGKSTRVRVVPDKVGTFLFHCDVFCGSGHEEMAGRIVVVAARESRR